MRQIKSVWVYGHCKADSFIICRPFIQNIAMGFFTYNRCGTCLYVCVCVCVVAFANEKTLFVVPCRCIATDHIYIHYPLLRQLNCKRYVFLCVSFNILHKDNLLMRCHVISYMSYYVIYAYMCVQALVMLLIYA